MTERIILHTPDGQVIARRYDPTAERGNGCIKGRMVPEQNHCVTCGKCKAACTSKSTSKSASDVVARAAKALSDQIADAETQVNIEAEITELTYKGVTRAVARFARSIKLPKDRRGIK